MDEARLREIERDVGQDDEAASSAVTHDLIAEARMYLRLVAELKSVLADPLCDGWTLARLREMPTIAAVVQSGGEGVSVQPKFAVRISRGLVTHWLDHPLLTWEQADEARKAILDHMNEEGEIEKVALSAPFPNPDPED